MQAREEKQNLESVHLTAEMTGSSKVCKLDTSSLSHKKTNKQTNKRSLRPMKLVTKLPKPLFLTSPKDEFNKS